ncbi:MAG TPA: dienelactone hydrolase family protein, partial [Vicinamibacteria bacterium]|nr:dienelactone hydrolase family protein [Vicinamibacteria bacterium]
MEPKNPREFDQRVYDLFDKYVHGDIDRRGFIDGAGRFGVAGMTGAMILDTLTPRFAEAEVVAKDDKRIVAE